MMESDNYELNALLIENEHLKAVNKDLLEALDLSMKWLNSFHPDFELVTQWNEDVEKMQSAIRKAKGEL
jgi:hypothetical protein